MAITAQDVKKLREMTGCGMMDCKKALTEAEGDLDRAADILREKGLAGAEKKAGRIAAEGIVYAYKLPQGLGEAGEVYERQDSSREGYRYSSAERDGSLLRVVGVP